MARGPLKNEYYPSIPLSNGWLDNSESLILQGLATLTTSATEYSVWTGPTDTYVFPSDAGESMELVSDDISDTRLMQVKGLDSNFDEVEVLIPLTGTTPVPVPTQLSRVNTLAVAVNNPASIGSVDIRAAGGGTVYGNVDGGSRMANQAIYTVPRNKTLSIVDVFHAIDQDSGTSTGVVMTLNIKLPSDAAAMPSTKIGLNKSGTSAINLPITTGATVRSMSDLVWSAESTSNNTVVTTFIQGVLYDS